MTSVRSALLVGVCGVAVTVAACEDDAVTPSPVVNYAAIQFVNAVSDTGEMDFRVVDIVSNAGLFDAEFRDVDTFPHAIEAGQRRIRVFMSSATNQAVASDVVWDTLFNFLQDERYTFTLEGYARTGQTPALRAVIEQKVAAPAVTAGQVAIRVRHLAPTLDPDPTTAVDVWVVPRGTAALSGTPTLSNVAFGDLTNYVNVATGTYRVAVTATGTTAPILFQSNVPAGSAPSGSGSAIAGTNREGSALTIGLTGRSVPGSGAPAGAAALSVDSIVLLAPAARVYAGRAHGFLPNDIVRVSGAAEAAYNGSVVVSDTGRVSRLDSIQVDNTVTPPDTTEFTSVHPFFEYVVSGTPASPATGPPVYRAGLRDFTYPNIVVLVDRRP